MLIHLYLCDINFDMSNFKAFLKKSLYKAGLEVQKTEKSGKFVELAYLPRYTAKQIELNGNPFQILDGLSFYYSYLEIFEEKIYDFKSGTDSPIILDCGSNIGTSIVFFKSIYPKAQITGYEADPKIFETLKSNIETGKYESVSLKNKALWDEITELSFSHEGADAGRVNSLDKLEGKEIKVSTVKLSEEMKKFDKIDFLKMDIEGAETRVIPEISDELKRVKNLFIEFHTFENKEQSLSETLKVLESNGFKYWIHTQYAPSQPLIETTSQLGMDLQLNIFAKRVK